MENVIKAAVERGASDVHLKAGDVFRARIDGKLVPLTKQRLTPEQTKAIALKLIPSEEDRKRIDALKDYDCSWGAPGIGRFRVNILRQRSSFMIVMRVIPFEVPTFETLHLPRVLEAVAERERGLILVSGIAGSGKSSTMAAMVNHINQRASKHIVTLENPIEFLHRDLNSSVTQREIGSDTPSIRAGLRAALRQDPDVILISEMRDAEVIDVAMKVAEMGQLVISAMHTPDVATTIARLIATFPPEEQGVARLRLADAFVAIVAQRLVARADGKGRFPAVEVLLSTDGVRELMRDAALVGELKAAIEADREKFGSQSFEQHLADLVEAEIVSEEAALAATPTPADLEAKLSRVRRRSKSGKRADADEAVQKSAR